MTRLDGVNDEARSLLSQGSAVTQLQDSHSAVSLSRSSAFHARAELAHRSVSFGKRIQHHSTGSGALANDRAGAAHRGGCASRARRSTALDASRVSRATRWRARNPARPPGHGHGLRPRRPPSACAHPRAVRAPWAAEGISATLRGRRARRRPRGRQWSSGQTAARPARAAPPPRRR